MKKKTTEQKTEQKSVSQMEEELKELDALARSYRAKLAIEKRKVEERKVEERERRMRESDDAVKRLWGFKAGQRILFYPKKAKRTFIIGRVYSFIARDAATAYVFLVNIEYIYEGGRKKNVARQLAEKNEYDLSNCWRIKRSRVCDAEDLDAALLGAMI
jgi:hypothetical protein